MANKALKEKIKQACRLNSEFQASGNRLKCKTCNTFIPVTNKTKMIELEEHFKSVQHVGHMETDDRDSESNEEAISTHSDSNLDSVVPSSAAQSSVTTDFTEDSSLRPEMDDEVICEYEHLVSYGNIIKTEFEPKVEVDEIDTQLYADLIELCLATNISLKKLTGPEFRSFVFKHFGKSIPSLEQLRSHVLKPMYEAKIDKIKEIVGQNKIYLIVKQQWYEDRGHVVIVLVGVLDGKPSRSYLYKLSVMKNVDLTVLSQEILAILNNLYRGLVFDKLSLLVTDDCNLSMEIGRFLKTLFPKLRHVTCLIKIIDSWCESFRNEKPLVRDYVSTINAIFASSPKLVTQFKSRLSKPVEFCLGSPNLYGVEWMEASEIFFKESRLICSLISESIDLRTNTSANQNFVKLAALFEDKALQVELIDLSGYQCLRESIKQLSINLYNLPQLKKIITDLGRYPKRSALINKVKDSLSNFPDLEALFEIAENLNPIDKSDSNYIFLYAPLCVGDSNKCYKLFQSIMEDNEGSVEDSDLETWTFLAYNKDL